MLHSASVHPGDEWNPVRTPERLFSHKRGETREDSTSAWQAYLKDPWNPNSLPYICWTHYSCWAGHGEIKTQKRISSALANETHGGVMRIPDNTQQHCRSCVWRADGGQAQADMMLMQLFGVFRTITWKNADLILTNASKLHFSCQSDSLFLSRGGSSPEWNAFVDRQ